MRARGLISAGLSLLYATLLSAMPTLAGATQLTVCLEEGSPPNSFKFGKKFGGFDYDVSRDLAARLGRTFKVQWYESENDEENVPKLEANALLSAGLCQLIGGYPLMQSALGAATQGSFRLPDYAGQKRSERLKLVKLKVVTATAPYNRAVFAAIVGPNISGEIKSLDEFAGTRILAEVATLPGVLLMRYNNGALVDDTTHISPLRNLFKIMDAGKGDTTLIGLSRFDRYRYKNPQTKLRFAGYISPLGFNLGYAALTTSKDLIARVNTTLAEMSADGSLKTHAANNSMTLMAPQKPDVMGKLRLP